MKNYYVYTMDHAGNALRFVHADEREPAIAWVKRIVAQWAELGRTEIPRYKVCYNGHTSTEVFRSTP